MIMRLTTPVHITPVQATIDYSDKILLLGSCFADNVGENYTTILSKRPLILLARCIIQFP